MSGLSSIHLNGLDSEIDDLHANAHVAHVHVHVHVHAHVHVHVHVCNM